MIIGSNGKADIPNTKNLLTQLFVQADLIMESGGEICITQTKNWSMRMSIGTKCDGSNFELVEIQRFKSRNFPGYTHRVTYGDESVDAAMNGEAYTFIFKKR